MTDRPTLELLPDPLLTLPGVLRALASLVESATWERETGEWEELAPEAAVAIDGKALEVCCALEAAGLLGMWEPMPGMTIEIEGSDATQADLDRLGKGLASGAAGYLTADWKEAE